MVIYMGRELLHTPEGVRDVYGQECLDARNISKRIHEEMKRFGYEDICTPTFEFFDVFSKNISDTSAKELYKFFDEEGNTLVLRSDFTPSVARCASKYFLEDNKQIRLCYSGNTFSNTLRLQGKLRENTEIGAELMNDASVYADAEIIALMIQSIKDSGLENFQVSIGDADYFKGICEEAGIDSDAEAEIREQILVKNYFAAEKIMIDRNLPEKYRDMLLRVSEFTGSVDALDGAAAIAHNDRSLGAVERLKTLYKVLVKYGIEKYVSFDLSMLSKYNYYTGVIFKAYTYGVGDAIATGGRYDNLLDHFGKNAPAIGFMIIIDDLMKALHRQNVDISDEERPIEIIYTDETYSDALSKALKLRSDGKRAVLIQT